MNANEELQNLYRKRGFVDAKIFVKKIEIAKKEGRVVDSIDDLVCQIHKTSKFKENGTIEGSMKFEKEGAKEVLKQYGSDKGGLKTYICEECDNEKNEHKPTEAHECNHCGIVYGKPITQRYNEIAPLSGSKGEEYYCSVCHILVGRYIWMHS